MFYWLAFGYIWLVGVRDFVLSRALINATALDAELNLVARWVAAKFGTDALGLLKLFSLLVFTAAVLGIARRRPRLARLALGAGVATYALLSVWWDIVLAAPFQGGRG